MASGIEAVARPRPFAKTPRPCGILAAVFKAASAQCRARPPGLTRYRDEVREGRKSYSPLKLHSLQLEPKTKAGETPAAAPTAPAPPPHRGDRGRRAGRTAGAKYGYDAELVYTPPRSALPAKRGMSATKMGKRHVNRKAANASPVNRRASLAPSRGHCVVFGETPGSIAAAGISEDIRAAGRRRIQIEMAVSK